MITGTTNGLSPLARGTHACFTPYVWQSRFIPAGAGNTETCRRAPTELAVYPRWRGEHVKPFNCRSPPSGLSPLARGTPTTSTVRAPITRFIPAGAGNTQCTIDVERKRTVYPRWRGEHEKHMDHNVLSPGLSPLARGTRDLLNLPPGYNRFIPAGAGNTCNQHKSGNLVPVYPR